MNNFSANVSLKKRLNVSFFIYLCIISFITLCILVWALFVNSPDTFNLKRPAPYLLLPIYLIIRLIFLKIETDKNINTNKIEELVKFLLFVCFLTIISMKIFPLDIDNFFVDSLTANFISFNILSSTKSIIRVFITNLILFIPIGLLIPMVIDKFRNISNCIIFSLAISVSIYIIQIVLHLIGIYTASIISLDLLLINIIGATIGNKLYYLFANYILSERCTNS